MRFNRYLMLVLLVTATIPCLVMTSLQYRMASETIQRYEQIQKQLSESTEQNLVSRLNTAKYLLMTVAEFIKNEGLENVKVNNAFLSSVRKTFPDFLNIHVDDREGVTVAFCPEENNEHQSNIGVDHRFREHWKNKTASNDVKFSGIVDATGAASGEIINLSIPIKDNDLNIIGYAVAAIDLKELSKKVLPSETRTEFEIVVTDASGKIIFSSVNINKVPVDLSFKVTEAFKNHSSNWLTIEGSGSCNFLVYATQVPGTSWVLSILSEQESRAELIKDTVLVNVFVWLIILSFTVLSSFYISRPLTESVKKLMSQISAGRNRPTKSEVVTSPKELKDLQHKFSFVSSQLNKANSDLEAVNNKLQEEVERQVQKISEQEFTMSHVFKSLTEGLLLIGKNNEILYANAAVAQLLGVDLLGRNINFFEELFREKLLVKAYTGELKVSLSDERCIELVIFDIPMSGIVVKGILLHDVTTEEEINRLKDNLIGAAAHELKSPLATIRLQAEDILANENDRENKDKLHDILHDTDSMKNLIESWLNLSRLESGAYEIHKEYCQLKPLIKQAVRVNKVYGDFELSTDISEDAQIVYVDRNSFVQVLSNLISNALRYSSEERKPFIEITAKKKNSNLFMQVRDNGIGINSTETNKIFEKFYQVQKGAGRKPGGTGLGLSIVKGVVELHEGTITVKSTVDVGTIFTIIIPYPEKENNE